MRNFLMDGDGSSFKCGARGNLHTPHSQPQIQAFANGSLSVTMTVATACVNPATNGVFNGKAFKATVAGSSPAANGGFVQTTPGNAGKTDVFLDLSAFEEPATPVPNSSWAVKEDSAMALNFAGTVQWCLINPTTGGPDCTGKGILGREYCEMRPEYDGSAKSTKSGRYSSAHRIFRLHRTSMR